MKLLRHLVQRNRVRTFKLFDVGALLAANLIASFTITDWLVVYRQDKQYMFQVVRLVQREVRSADGYSSVNKNYVGGSADTARIRLELPGDYDWKP
jgi:hypothetical protein